MKTKNFEKLHKAETTETKTKNSLQSLGTTNDPLNIEIY